MYDPGDVIHIVSTTNVDICISGGDWKIPTVVQSTLP